MLDVRQPDLRPLALDGHFGLEREALRVTAGGRMAHTPHPFPADHPRIVRDFCENQTEINTRVWPTAGEAAAELQAIDATIRATIAPHGERLWTNSNPPPGLTDDEIVPARFYGPFAGKSRYRDALAAKYGKALMAYCGIHVNFSFGERLVEAAAINRDALYLHVAAQCVKWGWAIVALTAASPRGDYASVRCSEAGYWNRFVPLLDFSSVRAYAKSIAKYVSDGQLIAPSELYYPVRLKPRGPNSLLSLVEIGVNHIEIRCVDLNPLSGGLVDTRDVQFIHLFLLWCAAQEREELSARQQEESIATFKAAARMDFDWAPVGRLLERMSTFFAGFPETREILAFEAEKFCDPGKRYAWKEACRV